MELDENRQLQIEKQRKRKHCQELENVEENYQICKIERDSAITQIDVLQTEVKSLQQQNELLNKQVTSSQNKFQEESFENGRLQVELKNIERKISELNDETMANKQTLQQELKKRDLRTNELQNTLGELQVKVDDSTSKKSRTIDNLEQELQGFKVKVARLEQENEELNDCLKNAEVEVQKLTKQNLQNTTNNQQVELEKTVEKLGKTLAEKESQIENLTQELVDDSKLKEDAINAMLHNKELRKKNKENEEKLIAILTENEAIITANDEYEEQVKVLETNLSTATKNLHELKQKISKEENVIQELKDELENAQNTLSQATVEREGLTKATLQLEESLSDMTQRHARAKRARQQIRDQFLEIN